MVEVLSKELKKASSAVRQDFLEEVALKLILRDTDCVCVCVCVLARVHACMHAHVHTDALGLIRGKAKHSRRRYFIKQTHGCRELQCMGKVWENQSWRRLLVERFTNFDVC